jgi:inorganic pyrophosphatase
MRTYIQKAEKFELEKYKKPRDVKSLLKSHVPFSGSPQMHPHDADKLILVADPYSTYTYYFEFNKNDVAYVEKLSNQVDAEGNAIGMVRIWVRKMSVAVRCTPFLVADFDRVAQS